MVPRLRPETAAHLARSLTDVVEAEDYAKRLLAIDEALQTSPSEASRKHGFPEAEIAGWLANPFDPVVMTVRARREHAVADKLTKMAQKALKTLSERIDAGNIPTGDLRKVLESSIASVAKLRKQQIDLIESERRFAKWQHEMEMRRALADRAAEDGSTLVLDWGMKQVVGGDDNAAE